MNGCPAPDLLVAYGEGVLPEPVEASVGEHLAGCGVCAVLRRDLRESPLAEPTLAEMERLKRRVPVRAAGPVRARVLAVGAIAAALIAGFYLWPKAAQPVKAPAVASAPKPDPVFRLEAKPAPLRLPFAAALVMRGQAGSARDEAYLKQLGQALDPYRAGRYMEAAELLRALGKQHPRAVEPPFYEGVARLLAGNAKQAETLFEAAQKIGGEALDDDILWYLAAARERNQRWEQAVPLLEKLCAAEGAYRNGACRALERR